MKIFLKIKIIKMSEESESEERINIMTLGNTMVGKTSFIIKYTENNFQESYLATVGIDFKVKTVTIKDKQYKLFFYDTTGQERFRSLSFNIIKNAHGIILMYDITNKSSFNSIPEWIKNIKESKGEDFPMILCGNKIDKEDERVITREESEELSNEYVIDFFEISNKNGINIEKAVLSLVKKILRHNKYKKQDLNTSVLSNKGIKPKKKFVCC